MLTLLTIVCTVGGYAQEKVILDFSKADWNFPSTPNANKASYTCDGYTITFGANSGHHKEGNGIVMGKKGATLSLPAFNFDVEKIIIKKNTGSVSGKVTFNIFVDNTAVSTQAKGCDKDKTFIIKDEFQKAGNIYTIKVTNANNLQTSAIEIYKKAATTPATTTTFGTNSGKTFTFTNGKLEGFTTPTATATKSDDNTDLSNLIEYTSSDADIVAVDSKTGELTFTNTKFGKATITATLPKTDTYQTSTDSYVVENKDNHIATSLSFNGTDVTLTEGKTDAGADFTGYTATEANNIAGTITYAASGDAVATVNETTGAVTVTPSVYGTTTITATFTPADPTQYSGSTATYKITNKKGKTYYTTLAAMKEAVPTTATNNAPVTLSLNLTDAIVTSVVGKKAAIQDATAGILVYGNNAFDLVKGKKYTGKVDVKAGWFNGYVEIVDWTPSADIVVEDAAELPLETITLAQFKANPDKYEFKRVKVSKVTTTTAYSTAKKATITQDGTDATLFGETTGLSVSINTIYDLIGCAYHHKTSYLDEYRIGIFAQEDITEIVKETPALSFAEATVTKELTAGTIDLQTITKPEDRPICYHIRKL